MEAVGVKPQSTRRNSQLFPDRSSGKKKELSVRLSPSHATVLMTGGESCCGRRELCDPSGRALVPPPPPPCCCNAVSVQRWSVDEGAGGVLCSSSMERSETMLGRWGWG